MIAGSSINLSESEWRLGAHNYKPLDIVLSRGRGVWVWDVDGNRYLDCLSAYSAVNQGHCHPKIFAALVEQASKLAITSRAFRNDQLALLYEKLAGLTGAHKILPMNSGAEAVESAIKAVRKWGYEVRGVPEDEAEIIVCANNFHGRTIAIVGFSTDPGSRNGFGPFPGGFRIVPFGDFEAFVDTVTPNTVAFLVEPIQGEAGVAIPQPGYFAKVRELCTQRRITLILDEIQTGLGRTGKLLAEEHEGIEADVTLLGKALSGGFYPVSAVLSNTEVLAVLQPGQHGSTFGGNPLACAVACAALDVLIEEDMIANAASIGAYLKAGLEAVRTDAVREVRGRGLMLAVELHKEAGPARDYVETLARHGVLTKDAHDQTIRIAPPLIVTREEADWAIERFAAALKSAPRPQRKANGRPLSVVSQCPSPPGSRDHATMTPSQTILMCAPGHFSVDYVINHWMKDQTGKVDRAHAVWQWERLRSILSSFINLAFVPSEPRVPDMVFTANAGLVWGDKVIVSRFASRERRAEEPLVRTWFQQNGYAIADWPQHVAFEGAGDALFDRELPILWFGHGFRSDAAAAGFIEKAIGCRTVSLRLTDPRFYHLDTCLCPLDGGWLVYYPAAFDRESQEKIRALLPDEKRLEVGEADALAFACNAVSLGRHVILNHASAELQTILRRAGFTPILTPLSEFLKSGGAAKCLTLKLIE